MPCSCPLHPGFEGPGEHLPDHMVWAFLAKLQRDGGQGRGWGSYFGTGKSCGGCEREAMMVLAGLGPSPGPFPATTPAPVLGQPSV